MASPRKQSDDEPYKPERILVTGGAGFIGSHVVTLLVNRYPDVKVVVIDKLDYCASENNLNDVQLRPNFKFVKGDITSPDLINYLLEQEQIDTIMHFAAQSHVDNSFGNSLTFNHNNVLGTHVLLEASKRLEGQIRRFIHVSTDEVYGENREDSEDAFMECSVLEPTNPYAATKAAAEFIAKAYFRSFNLPVIITRGNNVYGPHQYPEKLIPKFINQIFRDKPLTIHGQGNTLRNYLYVTDVAEAFDKLLLYAHPGQVYNIGGTFEISVNDIALGLLDKFGLSDEREKRMEFGEDRAFNDMRYHIDSEKLKKLGWEEKVSWEEGLERTIEWYKNHQNHWGNIDKALVAHPRD